LRYYSQQHLSPPALRLQLVGAARGARNCVPFKLNQARETKAPLSDALIGLENVGGEAGFRRGAAQGLHSTHHTLGPRGGGRPARDTPVAPSVTAAARRRPHRGFLFGGGQHGAQQEAALRYVSTHMLADPRMPPSRPRDGSAAAPSDLAMEGRPAVVGH